MAARAMAAGASGRRLPRIGPVEVAGAVFEAERF